MQALTAAVDTAFVEEISERLRVAHEASGVLVRESLALLDTLTRESPPADVDRVVQLVRGCTARSEHLIATFDAIAAEAHFAADKW